ncbi:MAG: MarR family transcriptional regulator [Butyrivibrio sp.]|nr:MarR family transcriptional regulator [Butyrivibrio sp.]
MVKNNSDKTKSPDMAEALLSSWLDLSASVRNERLVKSMTFQEVFICNILCHAESDLPEDITASMIVQRTGILKSQVNKILDNMEQEQLIERIRSEKDKRFVLIRLTAHGHTQYQKEHTRILSIMRSLIWQLGSEETAHLIPELSHVAAIMHNSEIRKEENK